MKKKMRFLALICAAISGAVSAGRAVFCVFQPGNGPRSCQLAVSVAAGRSVSVSAAVDPEEQQLPGCGMPECPQSCGNTVCLNEYGECTCGGTTYQTYYSDVKAVSGNSSVATVSYGGRNATRRGVSAGKTTVTVTGSMRQYTSTTKHDSRHGYGFRKRGRNVSGRFRRQHTEGTGRCGGGDVCG